MSDINLLPEELKPSGYISSLDFTIRRISTLLLSILLLVSVIGGGIYGFLVYQNNLLSSDNEKLKSEIIALEATEQRLALIKDRLNKASTVFKTNDVSKSKRNIASILSQVDQNARITEFELRSTDFELNIIFSDTLSSEEFTTYLRSSGEYSKIVLKEYNFRTEGYEASYLLAIK